LNVKIIEALFVQDRPDVSLVVQNANCDDNLVSGELVHVKLVESPNRPRTRAGESRVANAFWRTGLRP
jgi:hypothetical protein